MAFVTSASETAAVEAAYEDAAQYDMGGGTQMAKEFIVAGRILLLRLNKSAARGDLKIERRIESIESEIQKAEKWLKVNDSSGSGNTGSGGYVRAFDLSGFRE